MSHFYQFMYNAWVEECVARFGRPLPMNFIDEDAVGHLVPHGEPPLHPQGGEPLRVFRLHYDYRRATNERENVN